MTDLNKYRQEIDSLDASLLELLNRRAEVALAIGRAKQKMGVPVFDPTREAAVLDSLAAANAGPLPDQAVAGVFRKIIAACRGIQEE